MFQITGPALHRGRTLVLRPFEFGLARGEMLGVIGPNGAGKSTLLRAIAGLATEPVSVLRAGIKLERGQIGYLPQAFAVRSTLSVLDCILLGQRESLGLRVRRDMIAQAETLLDRLGLGALADRPMSALSGGQQQRVLIAQRLFRDPALMVLDEPTSALDLHHQLASLSQLKSHATKSGAAVIVALHDLTLAAKFCNRILLIAEQTCATPDDPAAVLTRHTIETNWHIDPEFLRCREGTVVVVGHGFAPDRIAP